MSIRRYNSGHRAYERAVSIDKVNGPSEPGLCYRQYRWVAFVCGSGTCICWILCIVLLMGGYDEMTSTNIIKVRVFWAPSLILLLRRPLAWLYWGWVCYPPPFAMSVYFVPFCPLIYVLLNFLPGASGLPARGDVSFACLTRRFAACSGV
jgi:hypothetical protein